MSKVKMTMEEQAVANEILSCGNEWETIKESDLTNFSLAEDPYKLPPEARYQAEEKHFIFRWIENNVGRLKEVMSLEVPMRWWPCNSTNTPFLQKRCSDVDGAVHCKDQILVFKPYWMYRKYQDVMFGMQEAQACGLENKKGLVEKGAHWSVGEKNKIVEDHDDIMAEAEEI